MYRKEDLKKNTHSSDYPAAASTLMLFRKKNKKQKNIKSDYSHYFLISTFPLDNHVNFTVLTLVELYQ